MSRELRQRIDSYLASGRGPELVTDERLEAGAGPDQAYEAFYPVDVPERFAPVYFQRDLIRVSGRRTFLPAHDFQTPTFDFLKE